MTRLAQATDLPSLLSLFDVSEVSAVAQPPERAESVWQEMNWSPKNGRHEVC